MKLVLEHDGDTKSYHRYIQAPGLDLIVKIYFPLGTFGLNPPSRVTFVQEPADAPTR